jgi:predicted nucleic acid-binding Zn finger protein
MAENIVKSYVCHVMFRYTWIVIGQEINIFLRKKYCNCCRPHAIHDTFNV